MLNERWTLASRFITMFIFTGSIYRRLPLAGTSAIITYPVCPFPFHPPSTVVLLRRTLYHPQDSYTRLVINNLAWVLPFLPSLRLALLWLPPRLFIGSKIREEGGRR